MSSPYPPQTTSAPIDSATPALSISSNSSTSSILHTIPSIDAAPHTEPPALIPNQIQHYTSNIEIPDEIYDRIPHHRKLVIVALLSFCSFLAPMSSTTVLSAVPEVAAAYDTTGPVINVSNALYMAAMGISPCVWGPLSQVYGRRRICILTSVLFLACSLGTAFAPNLAAFFVFRILTAFEGTSFLIVGASCIGDIYRPTERATAMGWFLSGTLIGPALGPLIGGILVTYTSWRSIFYLQSGLAAFAAISTFFLLPETAHTLKSDLLRPLPLKLKLRTLATMTNPWRVLRLFRYPNLLATACASSALVWNMYSLLTPIRYVLNPRFNLTTPTQSALFYLAPGCGYLAGTFVGGRWADRTVRVWMAKRGGERVPEDRLRSCIVCLGLVVPASILIYGWSLEKRVGGIALPVIVMFVQGVAQLFCFPSLNTYCLDVMPSQGAEVIAGNYVIRYVFAAMGTALVLPAVEGVGIGWFSTITALFLVVSAIVLCACIRWGRQWRDAIDIPRREARMQREDEEAAAAAAASDKEGEEMASGRGSSYDGFEEEKKGTGKDTKKKCEREPVSVDRKMAVSREKSEKHGGDMV